MDEAQVVADAVQKKYRIDELTAKIEETQSRKAGYEDFLKAFENTPDSLTTSKHCWRSGCCF